jgi:DNA ligase-1
MAAEDNQTAGSWLCCRHVLLSDVVSTSHAVSETRSRRAKITALATCLRQARADEVAIVVAYLAGTLPQGRIGLGWRLVQDVQPPPAATPALTVAEVHAAAGELAAIAGAGSNARRAQAFGALLARATAAEQSFLRRLVLGELRQGALEGLMVEAVAEAAGLPVDDVRRAHMLAGDLPAVASAALGQGQEQGRGGLAAFGLTLFRPVLPMLARPAAHVGEVFGRLGQAAFERKLDGARVQAHKDGDEVRIYTRQLNDVTAAVPELVTAVRALPARSLILDGEAIALRPDGSPLPFQTTMKRFGRKRDIGELQAELPLTGLFFDVLYVDGQALIDRPGRERMAALDAVVPLSLRVPRCITGDRAVAEDYYDQALAAGHEGLMAKSLDAIYDAGGRGLGWFKLKPAHTLDLVVLAAEWGSGRRQGWLSNLHLGARDPAHGGFVTLGKTFKGLTDELLAWQTERFLAIAIGREGHVVHVRPEMVVEIAFSDVQASPHYPGGMALRFARVKRYRPDKRAEDADTIDTVRAIHLRGLGSPGAPGA